MGEKEVICLLIERELQEEVKHALSKHSSPVDGHHVYGIICEELDEFFDLVKVDSPCSAMLETELLHVAVTALRGAAMYRRGRKDYVQE
jgi:hypothetical protein